MEMHQLLNLLPKEEQDIIKRTFCAGSSEFERLNAELCQILIKKPYPIFNILLLQWPENKSYLTPIITQTLNEFLNDVSVHGINVRFLKFLILVPQEIITEQDEVGKHFKKFLMEAELTDDFFLSLLSRNDSLFEFIIEIVKQTRWKLYEPKPLPSKEFILYQAIENKKHFVVSITEEITDFKPIEDIELRNNLIITKLVYAFSQESTLLSQLPLTQYLSAYELNEELKDINPLHEPFYKGFKLINTILEYIKKFPDIYLKLTLGDIMKYSSALELVNSYKLFHSCAETLAFVEEYYQWKNPSAIHAKDEELNSLTTFNILCTVYEILVAPVPVANEDFFTNQVHSLNLLLRKVKRFEDLCQILDDIIKLIFLRWENVTIDNSHLIESSNSHTDDDLLMDSHQKLHIVTKSGQKTNTKTGFICKSKAFASIFYFLKAFCTKKLHSADFKQSGQETQIQFQNIFDNVSNILWKYSLLDKLEEKHKEKMQQHYFFRIHAEHVHQLVHLHSDTFEHNQSSDEDNKSYEYNYSTRRKPDKKRRRATFSGVISSTFRKPKLQQQFGVTGSTLKIFSGTKEFDVLQIKERSIIPKILEPPERLVITALTLNQFGEVKQIITNFNLQKSQLYAEYKLIEAQQRVKQKLIAIYENYQQQERQSKSYQEPLATVEQIRNVAAKGFEVSKIISVIDNFAQSQCIKQPEHIKELINKFKQIPQYSFLQNFEENNLNSILICDLILSLPFNRDIATSILMVIKRQQTINYSMQSEDTVEKTQLPRNIGPLNFLENLCDCMRLLENKSLRDLLYCNTYSLNPVNLALELEREKIFNEIFYKKPYELSKVVDLKALLSQFQALKPKINYYQRFVVYVQNLTKLVNLRDPNCEYHIEELLKLDPYEVIGELIFSLNMTPFEIEVNCSALNLELSHVIAVYLCPEIQDNKIGRDHRKRLLPEHKLTKILNYIGGHNVLLAFLLKGVIDSKNLPNDTAVNGVFLNRLLERPEIEKLSKLYGGNRVRAALKSDHLDMKLLEQLPNKLDQLELLESEIGIQEPKVLKYKRIDSLVLQLIEENSKNIYLAPKIHDVGLRAKLIQKHFPKILTTRMVKEFIEATLQHRDAPQKIPNDVKLQLEDTLKVVTIYAKVSEVMQFETWPQAYDFSFKTPKTIFERLLQSHLYKLCYEWCNVVDLAGNFLQQRKQFLNIILEVLTKHHDEDLAEPVELNAYEYLLKILETFPLQDCTDFWQSNKNKLRSMVLLKYCIEFLEKNCEESVKENFSNYRYTILIFSNLEYDIRNIFWGLTKFPLLIVEQLIMNSKFEILSNVLPAIREELTKEQSVNRSCKYCIDKHGNIYDIYTKAYKANKARFQLGSVESSNASAFILLNFNIYQNDHIITNDCIDLLLRIYATKALDYQILDTPSSEPCSQSTCDMQQSLDSLCGAFQMPKTAPTRDEWIRDEEATHCMCCRRAAFTMLIRRHHCRACGRVVCFACSSHRMKIPELYEDVEVRICNDCHTFVEEQKTNTQENKDSESHPTCIESRGRSRLEERFKWRLSGNITHDKLLREEFCYDHAPSCALCLSILDFHLDNQKCVDILLFHCHKLQKLIVPNPEIDYELVAKMMNCLALAAKVRGGPYEVETIREHSEIIISVVQNGCESLLNHCLRKVADSLVQSERWDLALSIHLQFGFSTAGVMAAHGRSCLRAGCFDTAREKFAYCMPKLTNEAFNSNIVKVIFNTDLKMGIDNSSNKHDKMEIKRPQNSPPLLQEILKLIESLPFNKPQPETLKRVSIIKTSNTSLVSLLSRRKDSYAIRRLNEPAINVLNTLANLKRITKGQYNSQGGGAATNSNELPVKRKQLFRQTRGFEESLHYVLTYGSHTDVIQFLMQHNYLMPALKYYLLQKLEADIFIQYIFMVHLKMGKMPDLLNKLQEFDTRLLLWRSTIIQTCRYLETQNFLNCLYQLQVLLKDPIRASMTCVKFYNSNCDTFQHQHANAIHLRNAQVHLQSELDVSQWETINMDSFCSRFISTSSRRSSTASTASSAMGGNFQMHMEAKSLNAHINTILTQLDVAKFLAECEMSNDSESCLTTMKVVKQIRSATFKTLPTLFQKTQDKIDICILILLCGKNVAEGYGLAYRIIQCYKLPAMRIYAASVKYLARNQRLSEVEKFLDCITSSTTPTEDIDELLKVAINSAVNNHDPDIKTVLDNLAKKIHDVELRISSHIFIGQLKSAYLLANKHERLSDIKKIMRHAEASNQIHIKKLCERKLQMSATAQVHLQTLN